MMMPFFDLPWALPWAPIAAVLAASLLGLALRRRARRLARLGTPTLIERLVPPAALRVAWWRALLLGGAAACAVLAFAGPRWGVETAVVRGSGVDVVLALDASLSMMATDVRPNRLEKMKEEARRFLASVNGDRVGLIAFAGRSYILTPLTVDQGALELFLDNLDPSVVGQAGSSLSRAIRQGTDLLVATETASDRALVVMSDGEAFEPTSEILDAAAHAADAGVTLITVGFGTEGGSTIPVPTAHGVSLKRDANGQTVVTRYTPGSLREAASAARGVFIPAGATDKATRIRAALASLRREGRSAESGRDRRARFQLFLLPALLLALLDTLLAEWRGRARRRPLVTRAAAAMCLLAASALLTPPTARGDDEGDGDALFKAGRFREAAAAYSRAVERGDRSPRLVYNLGTALLAAGRNDEAAQALETAAATHDPDLRYRALFNLGLLHLQRGRAAQGDSAREHFTAAADAYRRALELRPRELDAKWNYELANHERKKAGGGGGGAGGGGSPRPQNAPPPPPPPDAASQSPAGGGLDRQRAEQLLNSAARDERDVQSRKQRENRAEEPPGGKDW